MLKVQIIWYLTLLVVATVILCRPVVRNSSSNQIKILKYVNNPGVSDYNFLYETSDGTYRSENGTLNNGIWSVIGYVSTRSGMDKVRTQYYVADEKGYRTKEIITSEFPGPVTADLIRSSGTDEDDDDRIGAGALGSLIG